LYHAHIGLGKGTHGPTQAHVKEKSVCW